MITHDYAKRLKEAIELEHKLEERIRLIYTNVNEYTQSDILAALKCLRNTRDYISQLDKEAADAGRHIKMS